jgi:hypothetical protein
MPRYFIGIWAIGVVRRQAQTETAVEGGQSVVEPGASGASRGDHSVRLWPSGCSCRGVAAMPIHNSETPPSQVSRPKSFNRA